MQENSRFFIPLLAWIESCAQFNIGWSILKLLNKYKKKNTATCIKQGAASLNMVYGLYISYMYLIFLNWL